MARALGRSAAVGGAAALCVSAVGFSAGAEITPDDTLAARQEAALQQVAPALTPLAPYDNGDRSDCVAMGGDGQGLVAQLELDRRGLNGGIDPVTAAPLAKHIADKVVELVGTFGTQGRCHWTQAGAPGVMGATMSVAYALHRYGAAWPSDVKESIRAAVQDASWTVDFYLHNANITIVAAELLAGEALGHQALYDLGVEHLDAVVERAAAHGGIEQHAPLYTAHHVPPLVYLQALGAERERNLGRILLEYGLLQEAHQALPGGGYGAPKSRDYAGGIADGGDRAMLPVLWLLFGDPSLTIDLDQAYGFVAAAATDYAVPEVIRSILIDKADGYTFWTYTDAQQGSSRTPDSVYHLGLDGAQNVPWQTVVLPGGAASLGVAYGYRRTALYVSSGIYVGDPTGGHHILYQYQPTVLADTDHTGDPLGGAGKNDDPDDFICELYDYERMVFGRTAIALWDPTTTDKPPGVVRTYQDTRVHLPNLDHYGGEATKAGSWFVSRLGDVYLAYHPLGTIAVEETRDGGAWTYLRLDGRSGGIAELATTADFASLDDYASQLAARQVTFNDTPLYAEVEALDPGNQTLVTIRLEHRPEKRFVGGTEQTVEEALGHGLMKSPWVAWDPPSQRLTVARECYPSIDYDWDDATITETPPAPDCGSGGAGGTAGGGGSGGAGGAGTGGTGAQAAGGATADDSGCGCATAGSPGGGRLALLVLFAVGVLARRRRSDPRHRRARSG